MSNSEREELHQALLSIQSNFETAPFPVNKVANDPKYNGLSLIQVVQKCLVITTVKNQ